MRPPGLFDSLTTAIHESGKEQAEGIQAHGMELLPGVQGTLSSLEQSAIESFSHMQAEIERGQQAFQANLAAGWAQGMDMGAALDNARGALQSFLSDARWKWMRAGQKSLTLPTV